MARSTKAAQEARRVLEEAGIDTPPVDPELVAKHLGVQVKFEPLNEISGLTFHGDKGNRIIVNDSHPPNRRRFTLAHEIGHFLLHQGRQLVVDSSVRVSRRDDLSSLATDSQEIEANTFAANLLMPRNFVLDALREILSDDENIEAETAIGMLGQRFGVSREAMQYRLVNLGVLNVETDE